MEWPLPAERAGRLVPVWSVCLDEAQALGMAFPAYLAWRQTDEGARWLAVLRVKWAIEAAARERDFDAAHSAAYEPSDAQWTAGGWRGGRCDPHEYSSFDDPGDAAA